MNLPSSTFGHNCSSTSIEPFVFGMGFHNSPTCRLRVAVGTCGIVLAVWGKHLISTTDVHIGPVRPEAGPKSYVSILIQHQVKVYSSSRSALDQQTENEVFLFHYCALCISCTSPWRLFCSVSSLHLLNLPSIPSHTPSKSICVIGNHSQIEEVIPYCSSKNSSNSALTSAFSTLACVTSW